MNRYLHADNALKRMSPVQATKIHWALFLYVMKVVLPVGLLDGHVQFVALVAHPTNWLQRQHRRQDHRLHQEQLTIQIWLFQL